MRNTSKIIGIILCIAIVVWATTVGPEMLSTVNLTVSIWNDQENEHLYFQRGQLRQMFGNYQGSVRDFSKVVELSSRKGDSSISSASAYYQRGQAYQLLADSTFVSEIRRERYYSNALTDFEDSAQLFSIEGNSSAVDLSMYSVEQVRRELLKVER